MIIILEFPDQALSHFVRIRHAQASYMQDMSSQRESVYVPFERPTSKPNHFRPLSLYLKLLFKRPKISLKLARIQPLCCFNSCATVAA